jgi:hypothetical protein
MSTTRRNRETGTMITTIIYDNGTVTINCDDHDRCCDFDSQYEARPFRSHPSEWCAECEAIAYPMAATR